MILNNKHLIPVAANMASLLNALKDVPFYTNYQDVANHEERNSTSERSDSLSTLMQILVDQADADGFRLITINTEPKRVIMACNRQGRPPSYNKDTSFEDGGSPASNPEDLNGKSTPPLNRRNGRAGTSIRCGCRMRVNINFHSKLNAWRITSFECMHNHEYGSSTIISPSEERQPRIERFDVNPSMIKHAIIKFRQAHSGSAGQSEPPNDNDAALALTSLAMLQPNSAPHENTSTFMHNYADELPSPSAVENFRRPEAKEQENQVIPTPPQEASEINIDAMKNRSRFAAPPSIKINHNAQLNYLHSQRSPQDMHSPLNSLPLHSAPIRENRLQSNLGAGPRRRSVQWGADQPQMPNTAQPQVGPLKNIATTAIEIDRYAMLHSSFKKLIALACKKREWTEDALGLVGGLMEKLHYHAAIHSVKTPIVGISPLESILKRPFDVDVDQFTERKRSRLQQGFSSSRPKHAANSIVYQQKKSAGSEASEFADPNDVREKQLQELREKRGEQDREMSITKKLEQVDRARLFGEELGRFAQSNEKSALEQLLLSKDKEISGVPKMDDRKNEKQVAEERKAPVITIETADQKSSLIK